MPLSADTLKRLASDLRDIASSADSIGSDAEHAARQLEAAYKAASGAPKPMVGVQTHATLVDALASWTERLEHLASLVDSDTVAALHREVKTVWLETIRAEARAA